MSLIMPLRSLRPFSSSFPLFVRRVRVRGGYRCLPPRCQWGRWKKTARAKWSVVTSECQRGVISAEKWKKDEGQRASTTEFHQIQPKKKKKALSFFLLCLWWTACVKFRVSSPQMRVSWFHSGVSVSQAAADYTRSFLQWSECMFSTHSGAWRHMFPLAAAPWAQPAELPSSSNIRLAIDFSFLHLNSFS